MVLLLIIGAPMSILLIISAVGMKTVDQIGFLIILTLSLLIISNAVLCEGMYLLGHMSSAYLGLMIELYQVNIGSAAAYSTAIGLGYIQVGLCIYKTLEVDWTRIKLKGDNEPEENEALLN